MGASILSLQGVTKRYAGTQVLGGIDLEVEEGEFIAILGFSGAGKTTLISSVAGLVTRRRQEPAARRSIAVRSRPGLVFSHSRSRCSPRAECCLAVDRCTRTKPRRSRGAVRAKVELSGSATRSTASRRSFRAGRPAGGGRRGRPALAMEPEILLLAIRSGARRADPRPSPRDQRIRPSIAARSSRHQRRRRSCCCSPTGSRV